MMPHHGDGGFSRSNLTSQLAAFANASLTLAELQRWLTPVLAAAEFPGEPVDEELVTRLTYVFEDDSLSETEHLENARGIGQALYSSIDNTALIKLLPLYLLRRRFCEIVALASEGRVSHTGFVSFLTESKLSKPLKVRLARLDSEALRDLCSALLNDDFTKIQAIAG